MLILGIDTATLVSSVALVTETKLVAELTLQTRKTHSERLMPHIHDILELAGNKKSDLGAIAVSIGPGSFTGLRIGLGSAKALAYALNIPLIGVSTLAAMAYNSPLPGCYLSPTLDAQKGNLYQAVYHWQDGKLAEMIAPRVLTAEAAFKELTKLAGPSVVLGEGVQLYKNLMDEYQLLAGEPHIAMPRAASIALLGQKLLSQGKIDDVMTLEPYYIRRSEAEVLWEQKHQG